MIYETDTDILAIWNGTAWRQLAAATKTGSVLQVVTAQTDTTVSNSTTTLADTNLSVTITPSSTASTILVYVSQNGVWKSSGNAGNAVTLALVRNSTVLTYFGTGVGYTGTALELLSSSSMMRIDGPATTSAVTYKTQFANRVAAASVAVQYSVGIGTPASYITAMEIAG
jgi:hypothetical protein